VPRLRPLSLLLLALSAAPCVAGAGDYFDGRLSIHGYGELQLRQLASTIAEALKELPRMLDTSRRRSGAFRTLEALATVEKAPEAPSASTPTSTSTSTSNGVSAHHAED